MAPVVLASYATEAVNAVAALVATPLLLHHLGQAAFGVWVLAGSVILYLELFEFGFGAATTKLVAEDAHADPDAVVRTVNTSIAVLAGLGAVALLTGLVTAAFSANWFDVPAGLEGPTMAVFAILSVSLAISIPADTFGGALLGHQRGDLVSLTNLALSLTTTIACVAIVLSGGGLVALALASAVLSVAVHRARYGLLKRIVPGLRLSMRLVERGRLRRTAGTSGWFLLRDLSSVAINRLDLVVVGVLLGIKAVTVFALGLKLAQLGQKALVPLATIFFPHAASISRRGTKDEIGALLVDGTRIALMVGLPIMLVLTILARPAIAAWLGAGAPDQADTVAVLIALALGRGLMAVSETPRGLLAGAGHIKAAAILTAVEAAANLVLSIVLARTMGVAGVAIGTTLAVALVSLPASLVLSKRVAGVATMTLVRRAFLPHLAATVVTAAALWGLGRVLPSSPLPILAAAAAGLVVYFGVYLAAGAPASDRERLLGGARALVRRRG
jgi:O-antigen/teichoic acid export membrane protein